MTRGRAFGLFATALVLFGRPTRSQAAQDNAPQEICIGGGDHTDTGKLDSAIVSEKRLAKQLQDLGASSHETYVRWSMIEPESGRFDFKFQDALLDIDLQMGLKWVPFIVTGPVYTLPNWYYKSSEDSAYVCLEHGQGASIQSLWNPAMRKHIPQIYEAMGKHFPSNDLESILIGITGNYGESIFPVSGPDWTADLHGTYHSHPGWWCGDPNAVASFQKEALKQFGSVKALNKEWGTSFGAADQIRPRLPADWPTTAARQWQSEWVLNAMTDYSAFCMKSAKKAFPKTEVYLVTGGHAPAYHALDISAQTKAAAAEGCGIRITNENDDFAGNFGITRMVASACRQYGTVFGYEPAGPISERGIAARTFNATSSGARCLHWYGDNIFGNNKSAAKWDEVRKYAVQREPVIDTAVFYPRRWMNLQNDAALGVMYGDFGAIRNACDYDFVDERMLDDLMGAGKQPFKTLIIRVDFIDDTVSSRVVSKFLSQKNVPNVILIRLGDPQGKDAEEVRWTISSRAHPKDDFAVGIYFSRFKDHKILFLNQRAEAVDLSKTHPHLVHASLVIQPYSMAEVDEP